MLRDLKNSFEKRSSHRAHRDDYGHALDGLVISRNCDSEHYGRLCLAHAYDLYEFIRCPSESYDPTDIDTRPTRSRRIQIEERGDEQVVVVGL